LVPQYLASVPVDPFDGLPVRYKVLPTGYVVYSLGTNGKDDGGDGHGYDPLDVTFTIEKAVK
jgi:hypothetical protein